MLLKAEISIIRTTPFSADEIASLSQNDKARTDILREEKVLGEERIETITADSPDELKDRVLVILDRLHPTPIIVKTEVFPDSFLVGKQYYHADPKGIFESVAFTYNPDHPAEVERRRREMERNQRKASNPVSASPRPDWESSSKSEAEKKAEFEKQIEEDHKLIARAMGLDSYSDFINFMKNSIEENLSPSGDNFQEAMEKGRKKLMQQYYEHGGYGAFTRLENPKEVLRNTRIIFRVIGRDSQLRINHLRYYLRSHNIRASATSNEIHD